MLTLEQRTGITGDDLAARFGRDAAHTDWFYGIRLAIKTDLGSRIVRAWSIVPAAVNERAVAAGLLAARGTTVLVPPAKGQPARSGAC